MIFHSVGVLKVVGLVQISMPTILGAGIDLLLLKLVVCFLAHQVILVATITTR